MSFSVKRIILVTLTAVYVLAALLFHKFLLSSTAGITVLVVAFVILLGLEIAWWRCPYCRRHFHKSPIFISHCPYCGKELK